MALLAEQDRQKMDRLMDEAMSWQHVIRGLRRNSRHAWKDGRRTVYEHFDYVDEMDSAYRLFEIQYDIACALRFNANGAEGTDRHFALLLSQVLKAFDELATETQLDELLAA